MAACTWKGVTRRGARQPGAMDIAPSGPWVEARCRQGWRHLIVTAATGEITMTPDAYDAHLGVDLAEAD